MILEIFSCLGGMADGFRRAGLPIEAAILQGFPEGWHFAGETKRARWSQIGQAMPPPLAHAVASSIARWFAKEGFAADAKIPAPTPPTPAPPSKPTHKSSASPAKRARALAGDVYAGKVSVPRLPSTPECIVPGCTANHFWCKNTDDDPA